MCEKLSHNYFKLNTDASVIFAWAFGGGILRTHNGKLVFAFYKEFGEVDVLIFEALSLLWGLKLCQERGVREFTMKTDSSSCFLS